MEERFRASMLLAAAGDAIGYRDDIWEFNPSGADIHAQLKEMGGQSKIDVSKKGWMVSDDTVLHLATAEGMISAVLACVLNALFSSALYEEPPASSDDELMRRIMRHYLIGGADMNARAPGVTTMRSFKTVSDANDWRAIPFHDRHMGCGAAMRAMCIGLRYPDPKDIDKLIMICVESSRISHHHPTAYLGSVACALFTSYALLGYPVVSWGKRMLDEIPRVEEYVRAAGRDVDSNLKHFYIFVDTLTKGLKARNVLDGVGPAVFPERYGVQERDDYYNTLKHGPGMAGACGDDAVVIAYDALLGSGSSWSELVDRGVLHGGDNDSTGTMAGAWFGALYGLKGVHRTHYEGIEYYDRLVKAADKLFALSGL